MGNNSGSNPTVTNCTFTGNAQLGLGGGSWLRVYLWVHIASGWLLTTLLVVGLTGLVRK